MFLFIQIIRFLRNILKTFLQFTGCLLECTAQREIIKLMLNQYRYDDLTSIRHRFDI